MSARVLVLPNREGLEELRRWMLAAAIVCAAHGGAMATYLLRPAPEPEGAAMAPAVILDMAPVPVAPTSPHDIAPGPEMVEAAPMAKPPEQVEPHPIEPIQKVEAPAEVTLPEPTPKTADQKPEEKPDIQQAEVPPVPQQENPAPQTTAAPRFEQQTALTPQAPSPGSNTAASQAAMVKWRDLVMARLQQNKRYPRTAEARRQQGVVLLNFTVDRSGRVTARSVARSSGVPALDEEVLAMVQRAQPLPAFPAAMTEPSMSLAVPIRFTLR